MLFTIQNLDAQLKPTMFFTENDGLAGNTVRDLLLDSKGILWIATDNGISKYDGAEFENIYKSDGLPSNRVGALALGSGNTIFAGCSLGGLVIIRNDSVINILKPEAKFKHIFRKLFFSPYYKTLFVGTENGIYILKGNKLIPIDYNKDTTNRSIILSITAKDSKIFFTVLKGKTQGVYQLSYNSRNPEKSTAQILSDSGRFSSEIIDNMLFTAERNKLFKYDLNKPLKNHSIIPFEIDFFIWKLCPYKNGKLWIGGLGDGRFKGGIYLYDAIKNKILPSYLPQNTQSVNAILYDSISGVTWFGRDNGLMAYKETPFEYFTLNGKDNILDIGFAGDSLMILTEKKVLYYHDGKFTEILTKEQVSARIKHEYEKKLKLYGFNFNQLFDISYGYEFTSFNKTGYKLYIQTGNGSISIPDLKTYLPSGYGAFTLMDNNSAYSAVSYTSLYYIESVLKPNINKEIKDSSGLLTDIFKIVESSGVYYFARENNGLFIIDGKNKYRLNETTSRLDNKIKDIDKDADGKLWCISGNNRLFRIGYKDKPFIDKELDLQNMGIKGNNVKWMKFVGSILYIATNEGLNVMNQNSLFAVPPQHPYFFNNFNAYNFIPATSPIVDKNGNMLVHTTDEIIWIKPTQLNDLNFKPDIHNVMINEKKVNITFLTEHDFPYSTKQISFEFRVIKYPSSKNFSYRYKINDEKWIKANQVNLQSLRAGDYQIILEITDHERNTVFTKKILFSIAQPFWLTYWFLISSVFAIGLLFYIVFTFRYSVFRKKQIEKTRLLVQNSELHLRSLQIQMNPHFMFNALTSLQFLILSKNIKDSLLYLGNLASIFRTNLEFASEEYILVSDEIEFLKKYITIELLRFKDNLQVNLYNECTNTTLLMPPMLIQPLIENAIKHGIMIRKSGGQITVLIQQLNNELQIIVEDNGIGRNASQETHDSEKKHFGLTVIKRRLDLLNELNKTEVNSLEINDLFNNDIPSGTKVMLKLAIKTT